MESQNPEYGTFEESEEAFPEPRGPFASMFRRSHSRSCMLCCFLILFLIFTFVGLTMLNGTSNHHSQSAVVIDAGSSHTHYTVFSWKDVENVSIAGKCLVDRGISTVSLEELGGSLETCLSNIRTMEGIIPGRTRLFLGATAGVRHLSPEKSNALMEAVRSSLELSGFDFRKKQDASVLSGKTEGLYDWITINYLSNSSSVGVMDMGGASCQISYECDSSNESPCAQSAILIHFKQENRHIFTKSEPCYGINSAHKRYLLGLIYRAYTKDKSLEKDIRDPCLSATSSKVFDISFIQDNKCSFTLDPSFDKMFKELPSNFTFTFAPGLQNQTNASCSVESLFEGCVFQECFSYPPLPREIHRYIGEASLYWEFYEILNEPRSNSSRMESLIMQKCLEQKDPGKSPSNCFKINYIYKLLSDGYRFRERDHIQFVDTYKKMDANWSLGLLIAQHPDFRDMFWKK